MLVVDELKARYGTEGAGLLAGFLSVVESMPEGKADENAARNSSSPATRHFRRPNGASHMEEKKEADSPKLQSSGSHSGLVSFEDMLKEVEL